VNAAEPVRDHLAHAQFHAREHPTGIGAAVVETRFKDGAHVWDCIVADGHEWHYVRVVGRGVGPFPNISAEDVEQGIEQFAATLPEPDRLRHLLNANPLHIDGNGTVSD